MPSSTPSHRATFTAREFLPGAMRLAGAILMLSLGIHTVGRLGWMPRPVPGDLDHVVLATKARLARTPPVPSPSVVLLGDSSCLMGVDAPRLSTLLGRPALNLATLSFLDPASHGSLLRELAQHSPTPPALAVLLLHPEALRGGESIPALDRYLQAQMRPGTGTPDQLMRREATAYWLGADDLRECLLQTWIPVPLRGAFGDAYGTHLVAAGQLRLQAGSLVDPHQFEPASLNGSAEYRLAATLRTASEAFRRTVPVGTRLAIGVTPVPASFATPHHAEKVASMLEQWSGWIRPDIALRGLPAVLPDTLFATHTHLTAAGREIYSAWVARELQGAEAPP